MTTPRVACLVAALLAGTLWGLAAACTFGGLRGVLPASFVVLVFISGVPLLALDLVSGRTVGALLMAGVAVGSRWVSVPYDVSRFDSFVAPTSVTTVAALCVGTLLAAGFSVLVDGQPVARRAERVAGAAAGVVFALMAVGLVSYTQPAFGVSLWWSGQDRAEDACDVCSDVECRVVPPPHERGFAVAVVSSSAVAVRRCVAEISVGLPDSVVCTSFPPHRASLCRRTESSRGVSQP